MLDLIIKFLQIFCQWARAIGCTLIGTVGSDEKVEIAKSGKMVVIMLLIIQLKTLPKKF